MKKITLSLAVLASLVCANEVKTLSEMIVTAQKTEEKVQDVPIAVSIFGEMDIEDKKLNDLRDLSYFVPNFYLADFGDFNNFSPTIRGISSDTTTYSTSVGLYIDGVPVSTSAGFSALLDDVERVEVLRGPQGTLYGKNTEAGVINVITNKPGNTQEGKISFEYGQDNKQQISGNFKTPIIEDKLYIGISGRYYNKDGQIKNKITGKNADDRRNYFGKIFLRATPTDRLELNLISSYYKLDDGGSKRNTTRVKDLRVFEGDLVEETKNSDENHALTISYDFDSFKVSSVTSYRETISEGKADTDYSPQTLYHMIFDTPIKSLAEEIKINGQTEKLKWLVGFLASEEKTTGGWYVDSIYPTQKGYRPANSKNQSVGSFVHLDYSITDKLNILGGIRYDKDTNEAYDRESKQNLKADSNNISPKIALEYKIQPSILGYASVAKGYKSGGFYMTVDHSKYPPRYEPETLWNYELGLKSAFLDDKLIVNASVYYIEMKDKQVLSYISPEQGYITNAASVDSKGFEVDSMLRLGRNWNIFGSFGYGEAKFNEFKDFKGDYKDKYLSFAPKYNYALGASFRGFGGMYASANIRGYGKMYLDNANNFEKKAYNLVDAKIGYEWDGFDMYLYANNLFGTNYDMVGYYGTYAYINPQREVGVKFTYRF